MKEDYLSVKEYFNQFNSFKEEGEWDEFEPYLTIKKIEKGAYFANEGKICKEIAFIEKGCFRYFHIKDGKEITISFFTEGEFVSALPSFLTQTKSEQIIDALEDSKLVVINYENLQRAYEHFPKFEKAARIIIQDILIGAQNRLANYLLMNPEERYINFLKETPDLMQRIPQHNIASYLGITPVSLSRIRKRIFTS